MQPDILLLDPRHQAFLQGIERRLYDPHRDFTLTLGIYAVLFAFLGSSMLMIVGVGLLKNTSDGDSARNLFIMGAIFVLGASISLAWILRRRQRRTYLAHQGKIIQGRLIAVERKYISRATPYLVVTCQFTSPAGRELRQSLNTSRVDFLQKPPPYGSLVAVVYLDDSLFQVL